MVTRFLVVLTLSGFLGGCNSPTPSVAVVPIKGDLYTLELALDTQARIRGMMYRTSLKDDEGMLFVFPEAIERSFWMKNCLIPLDILFLDSRGTVTAVHEMPIEAPKTKQESEIAYEQRLAHYWSNGPARFAIELQAGEIARLKVRVNDRIALDTSQLRSLAR